MLIVHNYYQQPGGEDQVFATEGTILEQYGHTVIRYTRHNDEVKEIGPVRLGALTLWNKAVYQELRTLIRRERPEVVHFHNSFPLISPSCYYAARTEGVPVVQTLHNYRLLCPSSTKLLRSGQICELCLGKTFPWPGILYACYRNSRAQTAVAASMLAIHHLLGTWQNQVDVYIALTEFARRKYIEGGLPVGNIVVKPNVVHPDPGIQSGRGHYALFVGRLSPEKGMRTLMKAWEGMEGIPLKIAGDGPRMPELHHWVQAQPHATVDIMGHVPTGQIADLIKGARFVVFPSECYETCPMSLVEAFACGVPAITSKLGAMAEIVEDGRTGLHFEPGNAEDLAAKVEWAWGHEKEMEIKGKEARREYERKYTAERNYEMLMEVYQQAIKGARR